MKKEISLRKVTVQVNFSLGIAGGGGGGTGIKHTHMHTRGKDAVQKKGKKETVFPQTLLRLFHVFLP